MILHCIECGKYLDEGNFYKNVKNKCKNCLNKNSNVKYVVSYSQKNDSLIILSENINRLNLMLTTITQQFSQRNRNNVNNQMLQHMKITPMLLLAQETLGKLFTCSKYLRK